MKRVFSFLVFLIALAFSYVTANAQMASGIVSINKMVSSSGIYDSLVDAANVTMTKYLGNAGPTRISIQATALRSSGTATAVCILQSSNDGTNYQPHFSSIDAEDISKDTVLVVTNTGSAQTNVVDVGAQLRRYYRLVWYSGGGTQKLYLQGSIWYWN